MMRAEEQGLSVRLHARIPSFVDSALFSDVFKELFLQFSLSPILKTSTMAKILLTLVQKHSESIRCA
jgi:hypothetical protein